MVALFISILLSLSTASADVNTSTNNEATTKQTTTAPQSVTTFGGSGTWGNGTF